MLKEISVAREYGQDRYVNDVVKLLGSQVVIGVRSGVACVSKIAESVSDKNIAAGRTRHGISS